MCGTRAAAEWGSVSTLLCSAHAETVLPFGNVVPFSGETFEGELVIARLDEFGVEADSKRIPVVWLEVVPCPDDAPVGVRDRGAVGLDSRAVFQFK